MRETFADTPSFLVTATVLNDSYVTWLSCWSTVIVGLERIVSLIDDNVNCRIAREFPYFYELDIRKFIPVCISAGVLRNPNVLTFGENTVAIIPKNADGVCSVCCNSDIFVPVAIKITN
jgi:hypothetical protein